MVYVVVFWFWSSDDSSAIAGGDGALLNLSLFKVWVPYFFLALERGLYF